MRKHCHAPKVRCKNEADVECCECRKPLCFDHRVIVDSRVYCSECDPMAVQPQQERAS